MLIYTCKLKKTKIDGGYKMKISLMHFLEKYNCEWNDSITIHNNDTDFELTVKFGEIIENDSYCYQYNVDEFSVIDNQLIIDISK
jgi:hypothetical protein